MARSVLAPGLLARSLPAPGLRALGFPALGFLAAIGLAGCDTLDAPLPGLNPAEWRTANGQPVTSSELDALRQSCEAELAELRPARAAPAGGLADPGPAYRPGGEGLINAAPPGLASLNAPRADLAAPAERSPPRLVELCLTRRGLRRVP